jgi:hypothetical protein
MRGNRLILCVLWIWWMGAPAAPAQESWRFIMTCDSRGSAGGVNEEVMSEFVGEFLQARVDFVIIAGDLVYGARVGPAQFEEQLWHWVEVMQPMYDAGIGVYVCRGNHEIGDAWEILPGQLPDPKDNYALRWVNVFGDSKHPAVKLPDNGPDGEKFMTYSVAHKNVLVVAVDEYAGMGHRLAHSLNQPWLQSQLESNTKPHVFVFGHEPAFRALPREGLDAYPAARNIFWHSLQRAGARMYLCGHDHFYDHTRIDDGDNNPNNDTHQFIVGTAGAYPYTWTPTYDGNNGDFTVRPLYHAERYGYVLCEVNGLSLTATWMERQDNDLRTKGVYKARDTWTYQVSPNLVVLHPAAGEWVPAGRPYTIRWKTVDGAQTARVFVEYSLDGGGHWALADEVDNTGTFMWFAPYVYSDRCLVRVSGVRNPALKATTEGTFTISTCKVMLSADLNGDCRVDLTDLAILAGQWLAPRGQE